MIVNMTTMCEMIDSVDDDDGDGDDMNVNARSLSSFFLLEYTFMFPL